MEVRPPKYVAACVVGASGVLLASALAACQWVAGFTLDGASADAGSGAPSRCASLAKKKSAPGGSMLLVDVQTVQTAGPCYWIDETEVPVREYTAWLARDGGAWSAECAFKRGDGGGASTPAGNVNDSCARAIDPAELASFSADKPIRCIDWCDAQTFCLAVGKRLCEGNSNFVEAPQRSRGDEWGRACSPTQKTIYPWGDDLSAQRCNVDQPRRGCSNGGLGDIACGPISTAAADDCRGDGGAHELVGNVAEWTATCLTKADGDAATTVDDNCEVRGGSYLSVPDQAQCATRTYLARGHRDPQTGIRCCADLTPEELAQLPP